MTRTPPQNLPATKRLLFAVMAVVVIAGVSLVALEVFLRVFYPGIGALKSVISKAPGDDSRAFILKPGADVTFRGLHQRLETPARWRINENGIRSDRPLPPRSGKFRVATFGDSETFGWSVPLVDTFQRRMEEIDAHVEVINLGTPGYNAENIADQMVEKLPGLKPDFVFYMFHKNDQDPALTFSPGLARSRLYLLFRKSQAQIVRYFFPEGAGNRQTPERMKNLSRQLARMSEAVRRVNAPLLFGFMDWRFIEVFEAAARNDCTPSRAGPACAGAGQPGHWVGMVNIEVIRQRLKRIDGHMSPGAHRMIAELLCRVISAGGEGVCVPSYWTGTR